MLYEHMAHKSYSAMAPHILKTKRKALEWTLVHDQVCSRLMSAEQSDVQYFCAACSGKSDGGQESPKAVRM